MAALTEFIQESPVVLSAQQAYDWHSRPGAFTRLIPPWERVQIQKVIGTFGPGQQIEMKAKILGPIWGTWLAQITEANPGESFTDVQLKGPFADWKHRHEFRPIDDRSSILSDQVGYRLPLGIVGKILAGGLIRRKLKRMFSYRHQVTQNDFLAYAQFQNQPRLRVALTGSSGLIGSQLGAFLSSQGHSVTRLVRRKSKSVSWEGSREILWDPLSPLPLDTWNDIDTLIHLAGESVAQGRWTRKKKQRIRDSRVEPTRHLAESFGRAKKDQGTLIVASAVGFYGDRKEEILTEDSASGNDFLAEVVRDWENASLAASEQGTRVVNARLGVVLTPSGGALKKQLLPFQMGFGGRIGNGRSYFPWITLDDLLYAIQFIAYTPSLSGPVHLVAPGEIQNREWTQALGRVLNRPTILPIPKLGLRLVFGEMAAVLLASQRVKPVKLSQAGFPFRYPTITQALNHLFGQS